MTGMGRYPAHDQSTQGSSRNTLENSASEMAKVSGSEHGVWTTNDRVHKPALL